MTEDVATEVKVDTRRNKTVVWACPAELRGRLILAARQDERPIAWICRHAVEEWLARREKER